METQALHDLDFMDLYLRLDRTAPARYRSAARDAANVWSRPLPHQYDGEIRRLTEALREQLANPDSAFSWNEMRFRVSYQRMANGHIWAVLRRVGLRVPMLEQLGFAANIVGFLRNIGKRDGLVVLSGSTGHGKTTTTFSLLQDYLTRFGGVGFSIEDPVEYLLEGPVGDHGFCYQVQVGRDEDWAGPLKLSLRWTPRYLLVGEIRTPKAAEQILRAATTGHLVLTTIHAGSIEESLMGLMHLAEQAMGSGANLMLAAGLTAAIHQSLSQTGPFLRYIATEEGNNGDPIRSLIRENRVGMINTYIDKQIARMTNLTGGRR